MVFVGESWPEGSGWNQHGFGWKSAWQWSGLTAPCQTHPAWPGHGTDLGRFGDLNISQPTNCWRLDMVLVPEDFLNRWLIYPRLVKPWLIQLLIYYNAHPLVFIPHVQTQQWLGAPFSARETFSLWPEGWKYQVSDALQNDGHSNLL